MTRILSFAFLALMAFQSMGATYYVATNGNDANSGSIGSPWLSPQYAANQAVSGDTVIVTAGIYTNHVDTVNSGVTFQGSGYPLISGFEVRHTNIVLRSFIFTATNSIIPSVYLRWAAESCQVLDSVFEHTPDNVGQIGLELGDWGNRPRNAQIISNRFINTKYYAMTLQGRGHMVASNYFTGTNGGDAIYLHSRDTTLYRNHWTNWSRPAGSSFHTDLIQGFAVGGGVIATNNVIDSNFGVNCVGCQIGNLSDDGEQLRIAFWTWRNNVWINVDAAMNMSAPYMSFYNNTLYRCAQNTAGPFVFRSLTTGGKGHNARLFNNIFFECGSNPANVGQGWYYFDVGLTNEVADYNLVIGTGAGTTKVGFATLGREANGINGQDPLFINPSAYNVAVATNSPAVGAALDLSAFGFDNDFLGVTRTDPWTIGAYQVPGTPAPPASTGTVIRATTARVGQIRRP
ncbi:MAG: hypothetical protein IT581_12140 [Verrucomicrobiales bacterium]|nr:hypothetical protein [Verrucomicrobiales bacterium]